MEFYGREKELTALAEALGSRDYPNALVYGRRRVGKSEIIKEFLAMNPTCVSINYQCARTNDQDNVESLTSLIKAVMNERFLSFESFESSFDYLLEKSSVKPIILVLDEYSYWKDVKNGFDSILQRCLDKSKDSQLKVILCGSELSSMECLDGDEYPLHGRFSRKIKVKPFDYLDAANFTKKASNEDKAKYYSCFGGLPYLLAQIDENKTFEENIIEAFVDDFAYVSSFVENTIGEEVSKVEHANSLIYAIASGAHKYKDILSKSHIQNNVQLDRAMKSLLSIGIISRVVPINEKDSEKKAIYSLEDNAVAFYYRYIFHNKSFLRSMGPEAFYHSIIEKDLETQFIPNRFETICREFLIRQNILGSINPPFVEIGKYYYDLPREGKNGEFDVVTYSLEEGYRSYEAKWWSKPVDGKTIEEEEKALRQIPLSKDVKIGFFSRSGYVEKLEAKDHFFTLEDMY